MSGEGGAWETINRLEAENTALKAEVYDLKKSRTAQDDWELSMSKSICEKDMEIDTLKSKLAKAIRGLKTIWISENSNLLCDCDGEDGEGNRIHLDGCEYNQLKETLSELK